MNQPMTTKQFIAAALAEDIYTGDVSTLASIDPEINGTAVLKVKEEGILSGLSLAREIFAYLQPDVVFTPALKDGDRIAPGMTAFEIQARVHTLLQGERLVLNCMQRMSGIATLTRRYVEKIQGYPARILDTRKTTPLFRTFEKEAVKTGGGMNHRMGLYDMVMLKDNHIDYCGGIEKAILKTNAYLQKHHPDMKIEIETRSLEEVEEVLAVGGVHRIMLDNFTPSLLELAVKRIGQQYETEASGGITLDNIEAYAATGVDFISSGAIIHHAVSLDLSLKAHF